MSIKQQEIVLEAETIKKEKTIEMGKEVDDFFESGGEITDNDFDLILTKLKESQMMTTPTLSEEYFNSQNQDKNYTYQQFSKDRQIINGNAIIDLIQTANLYINKDNYKKP
ncbi:MAG: hypothetical protein H6766_02025 [Candidatus Peribacteria bacterium]|nr:MAG: hypothetical protein H6766_02025 [Candidatus Peribacteria bacterium]